MPKNATFFSFLLKKESINGAIYITISIFMSLRHRPSSVPSHFGFLSCSEFKKPNQTAAERGEAKLCILNSKTTWSEFQKPIRLLLSKAKPSYVYSISKPHGQMFRNPNCCSKQHFIPAPCGVRLE